ncbi:hypothetical protein [Streptomyces globisporus]|uniref:hypothetical protein n=1 Tax=Streptomyces globisporus TaxID=1908 RepID=UPI0004C68E2E|nr:hypothetical protein [Streptomyces globisporus]
MTTIHVFDETGSQDELRERVDRILGRVAPLVETTTGLSLPATVTVRIVPVETWQTEQTADMQCRLRTYGGAMPLWKRPLIRAVGAAMLRRFRKLAPRLGGVMVMGATQPGTGDESQTLLVPRALEHTGALANPYLTQLLVHELIHHAQNAASGHRAHWSAHAPAAGLRSLGVDVLEEGHAHWADQTITQQEFGAAVDVHSAPKSPRYEEVAKDPAIARRKQRDAPYKVGRVLVASAIDTVGTYGVNRVWSDALLLPTQEEIAEAVAASTADEPTQPRLWATRLELTAERCPAGDRSKT